MSSFMVELWESIFTPGPTAPLLKATNVSFAALQLVLFSLLLATYSIHCVILSIICAGLWWSVNWFAAELAIAQQQQQQEQEQKERDAKEPAASDHGDDSSTEVETAVAPGKPSPAVAATAAEVPSRDPQAAGELKHRAAGPGTPSGVSTEDEWEKVSQTDNDKDK